MSGPGVTAADRRRVLEAVPTGLFVGGAWGPSSSGGTIDVVDPATGEVLTDLVAGVAPSPSEAALAELRAAGVRTVPSSDVVDGSTGVPA